MGEKQVALPVNNMVVRDGKLVMRGMSGDQIRAMPAWTRNTTGFNAYTAEQPVRFDAAG